MEKYIIKQNTVYIHGIKIDDHIVHSEICEAGKEPFMVKSKPQEIMNQSCRFYGEHFNERKQFTKIDFCPVSLNAWFKIIINTF